MSECHDLLQQIEAEERAAYDRVMRAFLEDRLGELTGDDFCDAGLDRPGIAHLLTLWFDTKKPEPVVAGGQGRSADEIRSSGWACWTAALCAGGWVVVFGLYKLAEWVLS